MPPKRGRPKKSATDGNETLPDKRARTMTVRAAAFVESVRTASARSHSLAESQLLTDSPIATDNVNALTHTAATATQGPAGSVMASTSQAATNVMAATVAIQEPAGSNTVATTQQNGTWRVTSSPSTMQWQNAAHTAAANTTQVEAGSVTAAAATSTPQAQNAAHSGQAPTQSPLNTPPSTTGNAVNNQASEAVSAMSGQMSLMLAQMGQIQQLMAQQQEAILNLQQQNATASHTPVIMTAPVINLPHTDARQSTSQETASTSSAGLDTAARPRELITAGMPLGQNLPSKLKEDIWDDKFIDMAALLYPDTHTTFGVHFSSASEGEGVGELKLTQQKKKISSIAEWAKAFNTFITVYIQKPGREVEAADLLTYMSEVQSIAECNLDWLTYDDLYRKDRAANKTPPPWSSLNQQLHNYILRKRSSGRDPPASASYARSQHDSSSKPTYKSQSAQGNIYDIPYGYCFLYHTPEQTCTKTQCQYNHRCFKCNLPKNHPQYLCGRYDQGNRPNHHKKSFKSNSSPSSYHKHNSSGDQGNRGKHGNHGNHGNHGYQKKKHSS